MHRFYSSGVSAVILLAPMSDCLAPTCFEKQALKVLIKTTAVSPTYATKNLSLFPGLQEQYHRVNSGEMFSTLVTVAKRLIVKFFESVTQDNTTFDSDSSFNEDSDLEIDVRTRCQLSSQFKT